MRVVEEDPFSPSSSERPQSSRGFRRLFGSKDSRIGETSVKGKSIQQISDIKLLAETQLGVSVWALDASRSGVLAGCDDGSVRLLSADLEEIRNFQVAHRGAVTSVLWHSDGVHFLSVGVDRCVRVWSLLSEANSRSKSIDTSSKFGRSCSIGQSIAAAQPLLSVPHSCAVSAAVFDPRGLVIDDSSPSSIWLISAGTDGRVRAWRGPLLEQYESVGSPDLKNDRLPSAIAVKVDQGDSEVPRMSQLFLGAVSMGAPAPRQDQQSPGCLVAVGCANGVVIIFRYAEGHFTVKAQMHCKNRHGKFSGGARVSAISWLGGDELAVSTHDDRVRLIRLVGGKELIPVGKFKGHSNQGKSPLGAHLIKPKGGKDFIAKNGKYERTPADTPSTGLSSSIPSRPVSPQVDDNTESYLLSGSECGSVFVWRRDGTAVGEDGVETGAAWESFIAAEKPDRLTACVPAPWEPEKIQGTARLPACTVVATLNGCIRVFYNRGAPVTL